MTFSNSATNTINTITAADASGLIYKMVNINTKYKWHRWHFLAAEQAIVYCLHGSTFIQAFGSNPFQKTQPASVVSFSNRKFGPKIMKHIFRFFRKNLPKS
jgi:hypothetical protein